MSDVLTDTVAAGIGPLGIAFIAFGVFLIGAIVYWTLSGIRNERKQKRQQR